MASRYGFNEAKIARFHKEGRGQGFGADYKPWVTVRDVPSRGRSHRLLGTVTGRIHHLLSDIERSAVLIYDFRDDVRDIREQFPLDIEQTQSIAETAGIRHPVDSQTRVPLVQTTDLLIDLDVGGRIITIARTVKSADSLSQPRNIEKLEIERRYWTDRDVSWGIITDREIPPILLQNLELLQGYATLDNLNQPFEGYFQEKSNLIAAELERWPDATLHEFCNAMDSRLGLETGATFMIVRHLLAAKIWRIDMMQPISEAMPMVAFTRATNKQNLRSRA